MAKKKPDSKSINERVGHLEKLAVGTANDFKRHEKAFNQHQVAVLGLMQFLFSVSQATDLEEVKEAAADVLAMLNSDGE